MVWLKLSTAATVIMGPFLSDSDGISHDAGLTIAQADIRVRKHGGTFAQTHNAAGGDHDEYGHYDIPLDTTDTNTVGPLRVAIHVEGCLAVWRDFMVVPANVYNSLVGGSDYLDTNLEALGGVAQSALDLKDFADAGYDPATNKVQGVVLVDTTTTNTDMRGTNGANTVVPDAAGVAPTAAEIKTEIEQAGSSLATLLTNLAAVDDLVDDLETRLTATRAAYLDAAISSRSSHDAAAVKTAIEAAGSSLATLLTNLTTVDTVVDAIRVVTDYLSAMLETDGAVKRWTENSLEQAPSGTGGDATEAKQDAIIAAIGTPVSVSSGAATLAGMLVKIFDDDDGQSYDTAENSLLTNTTNVESALSSLTTLLGRLSSARAAYLDNLNISDTVAGATDLASISSEVADLSDAVLLIPGVIEGEVETVYTLLDGSGNPIANADVWVTTDIGGTNIIRKSTTDDAGKVTFFLDAGTYYYWRSAPGYTFSNPDTEIVT